MSNQDPEFSSFLIPLTTSLRLGWIVPGFQANAEDRCIPALTDLAHLIAAEHDLTVFALQYPGREDAYKIGNVKIRSFQPGPLASIPKLRQIGPFWRAGAPRMQSGASIVRSPTPGVPLFFTGRVVDQNGNAVPGAEIDVKVV